MCNASKLTDSEIVTSLDAKMTSNRVERVNFFCVSEKFAFGERFMPYLLFTCNVMLNKHVEAIWEITIYNWKKKTIRKVLREISKSDQHLLLPINQQVPLRKTMRVGAGSCPAPSKSQDKVGISPLQHSDLNVHRIPEHFCDGVVGIHIKGVVGRLLCSSRKTCLWDSHYQMRVTAQNIIFTLTFHTALGITLSIGQPELHTQGSRSCNWGWWRNQPNLNDHSFNWGANISTLDKQADTRNIVYVNQSENHLSWVWLVKYHNELTPIHYREFKVNSMTTWCHWTVWIL